MSKQRSVFFEDWLACLRAHYVHVIQVGDEVTRPTLRQVLLHGGLSEDDVRVLETAALGQTPAAWEMLAPADERAAASEQPEVEPEDLFEAGETDISPDYAAEFPAEPDLSPDELPSAEEDSPPPDTGQQLSLF